jgi:imidazolonepropionase-like amidohydrolase
VLVTKIWDGKPPVWPGAIPVASEQEARAAVTSLKQQGADFAKVYSLLGREAYFAIANEARKQKLPFAGHVPSAVSVAEASDAGQRSIEHLHAIALACPARSLAGGLESAGDEAADGLFRRFVQNGTWVVPTNIVEWATVDGDPADPRLRYIPAVIQRLWIPRTDMLTPGEAGADAALTRRANQKDLELVAAMHRAGVPLLAGTDTASWNPYTFPGFSLHDQLALLVQAGLTPMEALQMATLHPARFLGKEKEFGTVRKGRAADLVLLNGNPLQDIRNTRKIHAVVVGGRLLDRAALDQMLAEVEAAAGIR